MLQLLTFIEKGNLNLPMMLLIPLNSLKQPRLLIGSHCILQLSLHTGRFLPTSNTSSIYFLFLRSIQSKQNPLKLIILRIKEILTYPTPIFYLFLFERGMGKMALFCFGRFGSQGQYLLISSQIFNCMPSRIISIQRHPNL